MDLSNLLIVRRLANREGEARKVTAIEAVPAMGLDGLASSAYGPEAALTILMPAGALGLHVISPIMAAILVAPTPWPRKTLRRMPGCSQPPP